MATFSVNAAHLAKLVKVFSLLEKGVSIKWKNNHPISVSFSNDQPGELRASANYLGKYVSYTFPHVYGGSSFGADESCSLSLADIRSLPKKGIIYFSLANNKECSWACDGFSGVFVTCEPQLRMALPDAVNSFPSVTLSQADLADTLGKLLPITAKEQTRYCSDCIFCEKSDDAYVNFFATDGRRAAKKTNKATMLNDFSGVMVDRIIASIIIGLISIYDSQENYVSIHQANGDMYTQYITSAFFSVYNVETDYAFPPVGKLFNEKKTDFRVAFNVGDILPTLKMLSRIDDGAVIFSLANGKNGNIKSSTTSVAFDIVCEITGDLPADGHRFKINSKFLLDAIDGDNETVRFDMFLDSKKLFFVHSGGAEHIVMPIYTIELTKEKK